MLSNRTNKLFFVERVDINSPEGGTNTSQMYSKYDRNELIYIIENTDNHKKADEFFNYKKDLGVNIDSENFLNKIVDTVVFKDDEGIQFLETYCGWTAQIPPLKKQNFFPSDDIVYWVIFTSEVFQEKLYYVFSIVVEMNAEVINEDFVKIFNDADTVWGTEAISERVSASEDPEDVQINYNIMAVKFFRTYMKYNVEEESNLYDNIDKISIISKNIMMVCTNYMSNQRIEQPTFTNYPLYSYQLADIYFMLNREKYADTRKFILDDEFIANLGPKYEAVINSPADGAENGGFFSIIRPIRTIENYIGDTEKELNTMHGGCICSSPGLGKTNICLVTCIIDELPEEVPISDTDMMAPTIIRSKINLIIVPNHLFGQWQTEYTKHIKPGTIDIIANYTDDMDLSLITKNTILLITYANITKKLLSFSFRRCIVDEFHEFFEERVENEKLFKVDAEFRWAVTGTPIVTDTMLKSICDFTIKNKLKKLESYSFPYNFEILRSIFRKNTKDSVEIELQLPKINDRTYIVDLSDSERIMMNSIMESTAISKEEKDKRCALFCVHPQTYLNDKHGLMTPYTSIEMNGELVITMHKKDYENMVIAIDRLKRGILNISHKFSTQVVDILYDYLYCSKFDVEICKNMIIEHGIESATIENKVVDVKDMDDKTFEGVMKAFIRKNTSRSVDAMIAKAVIDSEMRKLTKLKSNMIFVEQQLAIINKKLKDDKEAETDKDDEYIDVTNGTSDSEICSICLSTLDKDFTALQCLHLFCTDCINTVVNTRKHKCPTCNFDLDGAKIYTTPKIKKKNTLFTDMQQEFGTKISHVINIIRKLPEHEKIIIYCDSVSLIPNIVAILTKIGISSCTPNAELAIDRTVEQFQTSTRTIVLSSNYNASGLNLQFAKNIIIVQPIAGKYGRVLQIENQIIGRVHRIGQISPVNIFRIIIKNSVESDSIRKFRLFDRSQSDITRKTISTVTEL